MPLSGTLLANKDQAPAGYQPLLLATFTFADGSVLRLSTHNLNAAEGGTQYAGNDYLARIAQQDIEAIQSRSQQGIDRISDVTLHLYNADQFLYTTYEAASGKGFKGAFVKLAMVLLDIDPSTGGYLFTNDSTAPLKFKGICDAGQLENGGQMLTVRATTSHSLARVQFPIIHIQQRCVNPFPPDAASRLAGATDMGSWFWSCGYDPDQAGTDPEIGGDARRGNTTTAFATDAQGRVIADGSGNYISCQYTKADCIARGMYAKDSSNRYTGRFTAEQWAPANRETRSKSYTQGKNVTVFSSRNDSIYERSYPMVYGAQWLKKPPVANILGDGNSTRFEVNVCAGDLGYYGILQVVVNGILIPRNMGPGTTDAIHRWNFCGDPALGTPMATGGRNGQATKDAGYNDASGNPQGDPHGSICTIEVVVYSDLAQSNSTPDVRVLTANGTKMKVPNTTNPADQATWPYTPSSSPAWVLLDLLIWGNYSYSEIDLASFAAADAVCSGSVSYVNLAGATTTHNRFICEVGIEDYKGGPEVVQAVCRGFNAQVVPNSETGLYQLFIRQTLADQQSSPVAGSNYNTAVKSLHADGTTGNGYVAYLIDESVMQQDGHGVPKVHGPYCLASGQTPNRLSFPFQDQDNGHADDSISVVDSVDVARAGGYQAGGQQIPQQLPVLGPPNFDQGIRVANVNLAENFRGNENGDTRGTRWWDIEDATSRVEHLRVGHIVLLRSQAISLRPAVQLQSPSGTNIMGILARVEEVKPSTDGERWSLKLRWHEDAWYTDLYGQQGAPLNSDPQRGLPDRPPYPWRPYGEQPIAGDSLLASSDWSFRVAQVYETAEDGTKILKIPIAGCPAVAQISGVIQPPIFQSPQAGTANTGGAIPGGIRLAMAISVQDSAGLWSALSKFAIVDIPTGTNTNTAVTPTIYWNGSPAAWVLFGGYDEQTLTEQLSGTGTPSTITWSALNVNTYGPPDVLADSLLFRVKRLFHGVWGDACYAVATNTLSFGGALTNGQFVGADLTLLAKGNASTDYVPLANFRITANTGGVCTVTPDPVAAGIQVGDIFMAEAAGTVVTDTTIGDPNFQNAYFPAGFLTTGNDETNREVWITRSTGIGQKRKVTAFSAYTLTIEKPWDVLPDSTSRWVVVEAAWQNEPTVKVSASQLAPSPVPQVAVLNVDSNYAGQAVIVEALTQDQQGKLSLRRWAPYRFLYLTGAQGTRTITGDDTQRTTDGLILCDTSGLTGFADTLAAAVTTTGQTNFTLTSGAHAVNGTYFQIGTEICFIESGGGTGSIVVTRAQHGTTAATYSNGTAVSLPGSLTFTLLPINKVPNQDLQVQKDTPDINYVVVLCGGPDAFRNGSTTKILADNSANAGLCDVRAPGNG